YNMGWYEMILIDVPLFFAATFSFCNFYMVCQREIHTDWRARLKYVPFLMSVGIGLSVNNTRAVFEALFNKPGEFTRTPKYRIEADGDEWVGKRYRQSVAVQPLVELARGATTILKDNISWHFPFPAANTTPWQLEGTIRALARRGFAAQVCVQNKTVVTNAFKGEDLNHYVPIFERYAIPVLYNFRDEDMKWVRHRPKARMRVLDRIFPEGIHVPDFFFGRNIVHLPTTKCHIYTTTTGAMKNAFGGL